MILGEEWSAILELFGYAIGATLLAGLVCPLIGCLLLVRRTSFYGIVLPQFAAAGVAASFAALPWWIEHVGIGDLDLLSALDDHHAILNYNLAWALAATFGALGALTLLGRRGGSEVARMAAAFALAHTAFILFAHVSPVGEVRVGALLAGQVLAVGRHEFETIAGTLVVVGALFVAFRRRLVLVSFDRDAARVLGLAVTRFEGLLLLLVGATVAASSMTVGPVVLFGLLVVPPLAARPFARSMAGFFVLAALLGLAAAAGGTWLSFALDWPLGPAVVLAAGATLLPAPLGRR